MQSVAKIGLLIAALVFIVIGAGFVVFPAQLAALTDIVLPTAMARTDLRATYGGFNVGIGLFIGCCALRPAWLRPGVLGVALAAVGYGGGRLLGMVVEGTASPLMLFFLVLEIVIASVAFHVFRRMGESLEERH